MEIRNTQLKFSFLNFLSDKKDFQSRIEGTKLIIKTKQKIFEENDKIFSLL